MLSDEEFQQRLESPAGRYMQAVTEHIRKILDWNETHQRHDHSDPEIKRLCLREWDYLSHQAKILDETGRQLEES